MADSTADSTKSEDDSQEASPSKVSSSFHSSNTHNNTGQEPNVSPVSDSTQVVSNSDGRGECPPIVQPSKFGAAGSTQPGFWGTYTNPFVPRAPLRADVVSTVSSDRECLIAPSRLDAAVNKDTGEAEAEEKRCKYLKPSVLAAPKLGGSGFGGASLSRPEVPSSTFSPIVNSFHIRPSAFSSSNEAVPLKTSSPLLKPAKLPDPTLTPDGRADSAGEPESTEKASEASAISERLGGAEGSVGANEVSSSSSTSSSAQPVIHPQPCEADGANAADASSYNQDIVPDITKNNTLKESSGVSSSSSSNFVFGSNLSQRVTGVTSPSELANEASASGGFVFGESMSHRAVTDTNGSSESPHKDDSDSDSGKNRTLEESAREYQAKHETKTELQEVERYTGEEEESNVLQANAKLFLFDGPSQTWIERGRGMIRLNDMSAEDASTFQSRLVMRTQGSLRLVLNTKIWPGMTVERASGKSVRVTAMDADESIKVFLIMTNVKDSENLLRAIDWRVQQLKIHEEPSRPLLDMRSGDKRKADSDFEYPNKSKKLSSPSDLGASALKKEESDSSVQDPETEASCESHSSSLTIKSESD